MRQEAYICDGGLLAVLLPADSGDSAFSVGAQALVQKRRSTSMCCITAAFYQHQTIISDFTGHLRLL